MSLLQFLLENWIVIFILIIALLILCSILWRYYNIDEVTPTPPFVKFKKKVNSTYPESSTENKSITVRGNSMRGKNKIMVRREESDVSDNKMLGENEIEIGTKPGPKPKTRK